MPEQAPTESDLAELAGFTVNYFKVSPEMWSLFQQAMREDWTPDRLVARVRNTKWFKGTSQTERETHLLKSSDPSEYKRRLAEMSNHVNRLFAELGFTPPANARNNIAINALQKGWNDDQIRHYMGNWSSAFGQAAKRGALGGTLAETQTNIAAAARANGVRVSDASITNWLRLIMQGRSTEEQVVERIRNLAASAFPGLADEINAGQNVMDIAAPYFESMSRILEVNTKDIDLFDPTIRKALSSKDKDGKVGVQTIWEFENNLRADPRWTETNNARESMMSTGREVLSMMGLVS